MPRPTSLSRLLAPRLSPTTPSHDPLRTLSGPSATWSALSSSTSATPAPISSRSLISSCYSSASSTIIPIPAVASWPNWALIPSRRGLRALSSSLAGLLASFQKPWPRSAPSFLSSLSILLPKGLGLSPRSISSRMPISSRGISRHTPSGCRPWRAKGRMPSLPPVCRILTPSSSVSSCPTDRQSPSGSSRLSTLCASRGSARGASCSLTGAPRCCVVMTPMPTARRGAETSVSFSVPASLRM